MITTITPTTNDSHISMLLKCPDAVKRVCDWLPVPVIGALARTCKAAQYSINPRSGENGFFVHYWRTRVGVEKKFDHALRVHNYMLARNMLAPGSLDLSDEDKAALLSKTGVGTDEEVFKKFDYADAINKFVTILVNRTDDECLVAFDELNKNTDAISSYLGKSSCRQKVNLRMKENQAMYLNILNRFVDGAKLQTVPDPIALKMRTVECALGKCKTQYDRVYNPSQLQRLTALAPILFCWALYCVRWALHYVLYWCALVSAGPAVFALLDGEFSRFFVEAGWTIVFHIAATVVKP